MSLLDAHPTAVNTVIDDGRPLAEQPAWLALKDAATAVQPLQAQDGSIPDSADHPDRARRLAPPDPERSPLEPAPESRLVPALVLP